MSQRNGRHVIGGNPEGHTEPGLQAGWRFTFKTGFADKGRLAGRSAALFVSPVVDAHLEGPDRAA